MSTKPTPQANHTPKNPLFTFTGVIHTPSPRLPSSKGISVWFDNFLVYVPSLHISIWFDNYFHAFAHASYLKSLYPLTKIGIYKHQSLIDTWNDEQGGNHD